MGSGEKLIYKRGMVNTTWQASTTNYSISEKQLIKSGQGNAVILNKCPWNWHLQCIYFKSKY